MVKARIARDGEFLVLQVYYNGKEPKYDIYFSSMEKLKQFIKGSEIKINEKSALVDKIE